MNLISILGMKYFSQEVVTITDSHWLGFSEEDFYSIQYLDSLIAMRLSIYDFVIIVQESGIFFLPVVLYLLY